MSPEEITQYLSASHIAVIATINRSGMPHLTPNWYRYDGNVLRFVTTTERLKYFNLKRDQRISVCIYDPPSASHYVVMYGTAAFTDASTSDQDTWDNIRLIVSRYVAPDRVDDYMARWQTEPRVLVTVTPKHIATRGT